MMARQSSAAIAAAMAAREERIFSYDGLWPDRPLNGIGVDFDAAITQESLEGCAPERGIAVRFGEFGFAGQAGQLHLPQIEQRCDDGGGPFTGAR